MVFETTAYADSAIKPTSLLDHKTAQPKARPCMLSDGGGAASLRVRTVGQSFRYDARLN